MRAGSDMVADSLANRLADGRRLLGAEARKSKHMIDGVSVHGAEEFAQRIGPAIFRSAGDVERPRRGEREQVMRIER